MESTLPLAMERELSTFGWQNDMYYPLFLAKWSIRQKQISSHAGMSQVKALFRYGDDLLLLVRDNTSVQVPGLASGYIPNE